MTQRLGVAIAAGCALVAAAGAAWLAWAIRDLGHADWGMRP